MGVELWRLVVLGGFLGLASCSAVVPKSSTPATPTRSLGLAVEPGPCVAGSNTVSAAAFVDQGGRVVRYVTPADGELRVWLLHEDGSARPIELRWLDAPDENANLTLANVRWNLQMRFDSAKAGACPVRVEFQPAPAGVTAGLGPALATVVLQDSPPPLAVVPDGK